MSQSAPGPADRPRDERSGPRSGDQSVMPEPSLCAVVLLVVGWTICRPLVWAIDRAERWLVRRGMPT